LLTSSYTRFQREISSLRAVNMTEQIRWMANKKKGGRFEKQRLFNKAGKPINGIEGEGEGGLH
jgi:hypothetical protein